MKKNLFLLMMMLMPLCTWAAKQGYAVFDSNTGTLTFKYGEKPSGDNVYDTDNTGYLPKWYDYGKGICAQVKKVVFEESFSEARPSSTNSWFNGAKELTEIVDIKNLNTDEVTNMASMFNYCESLETIDLANFNTDKVTDMNRMFSDCSSLTSLDLSSFNVENVTNMEYMFSMTSGKSNLETINLGSFNAYNVKTFYYMFSGNSNLTKIETTSFNTEKATNYHSMFNGCKSLESIDVSNFNTSPATDLSDMFEGCTNLKELNLSNFDTSNATNISYMFYKCASLTSIDLSSFNTANVTSMGGMFKGCESLKELNLNHFNTENVVGMGAMFQDCKSLESLDIKNFNTSKCTNFTDMFSRCESLTNLDVTNFNTENAKNMMSMFACCYGLTKLDVANFVTSNVTNMQSMFAYCRGLEKLDLTKFDTGNVTAMSSMFMDCRNLTTLDLSSFNTENVTATNYMFYNCENLITIYISDNWITKNITTSGSMFSLCQKLKGQDGTSYNSENVDATYAHANAGGYMTMKNPAQALNEGDSFTVDGITYSVIDTENLKVQVGKGDYDDAYDTEFTGTLNIPSSVSGPDGKSYTVTAIAAHAFYRCKLSGVTLPNTLEEIGVGSFRECWSMTSINFPSSLTAIRTEAFAECKLLTTISIPASVRTISINAFQSCSGITSMVVDADNKVYDSRDNCNAIIETKSNTLVFGCQNTVIPNTVTTIAERSFFGCETLKAISFPNSVTSIKSHAFYKCTGLTSIIIPSSLTDLGDNPFAYCSGLESVSVEEGNTTFDTRNNCNAIIRTANSELVIGCKNSTIPETVNIIGPSAFYYCEDITSITLPDGLTEIANEAFVGCRLTSVTFPTSLKRIGVWAFQGCPFESLEIPDNVTEIGKLAFSFCNSLTTITLPNSLTTIGESAFGYSSNITTINSKIVNPFAINENVFSEQVYAKAALNVPTGSKEKYQSVDGWKKFANITEVVSDLQEGIEALNTNLTDLRSQLQSIWGKLYNKTFGEYDRAGDCHESLTTLTNMVWQLSAKTSEIKTKEELEEAEAKFISYANEAETIGQQVDNFSIEFGDTFTFTNAQGIDLKFTILDASAKTCLVGDMSRLDGINSAVDISLAGVLDIPEKVEYDGVSYTVTEVGPGAFAQCQFSNISMPSTISHIWRSAFWYSQLTDITIPEAVTGMGPQVFSSCLQLKTVTCLIKNPFAIDKAMFSGKYNNEIYDYDFTTATLYVPAGTKAIYETTEGWKEFTEIKEIGASSDAEPYAALSEDNTVLTFYYDGQKEARGGMELTFTNADDRPWNDQRAFIVEVVFDDSFADYTGLTSTKGWFDRCLNLTTFTKIENLNTQNVTDMSFMFCECNSLKSIDASHFNTSKVTTMLNMFSHNSNLESIDMSNFDTNNVQSMQCMFEDCPSLTTLDLSSFNTRNVSNIWLMFAYCKNLKTIYVSDRWSINQFTQSGDYDDIFIECTSLVGGDGTKYDENKVSSEYAYAGEGGYLTMKPQTEAIMAYAVLSEDNTVLTFYYDDKFTERSGMSIDSRKWLDNRTDIVKVNFTESMADYNGLASTAKWFEYCTKISSISGLCYLNTSHVTDMNGMFTNCSHLSSIDLTGFDTRNVTNMKYMFAYCSWLKKIYVGENWSTQNVTDSEDMFLRCSLLAGGEGTAVDDNIVDKSYARVDGGTEAPGYLTSYRTTDEVPYAVWCEGSQTLYFLSSKERPVEGGIYDSQIVTYTWDGEDVTNSMEKNQYNTAWGRYNIDSSVTTVKFEESFKNVTVKSTERWFIGFKNLTSIIGMENLNTRSITNMSHMFGQCESLTSIDLSQFNTENVINMEAMFANCKSLTELDVTHLNTSNVINMSVMFWECENLKSLDVSKFNTSNVTDMSGMFEECKRLTTLDVTNFDTRKVTNMSSMFYECSELTELNLDNFITSAVTGMGGMFKFCYKLTSLDLSHFDTSSVTSFSNMFYDDSGFTSLDLSNFDTSKVTDMSWMFRGCTNLETIYVGDKWTTDAVTSSTNMFLQCSKLVGGDGTKYNYTSDKTKAYAGEGGYLTYKGVALEPMEEDEEVNYSGGNCPITEETSLSGTIIDNVYYNISSSNGHFDAEEGCLVVTKTMSDEDVEAVLGKDLMSDDVKQTFAGIVIEVPAGKGKVTVNAETTGGMTLKVKIGNRGAVKLTFDGKTKMKVPYNVSEPTYVYIYAAESAAQARERIAKGGDEPSVKIYGIGIEPSDILLGDADNDDVVDVNDVVSIVNHILNKTAVSFNEEAADVNGDGSIDVADIVATVNIILGKSGGARSKANASSAEMENDHLSLTGNERDGYSLSLNNAGRYLAAQFDIRLADGQTLEAVHQNMMRCGNHQMAYAKIDEGLYRVLIYNIGGETFDGNNGELLRMRVAGSGELTVSDIKFITDAQIIRHFAPLSAGTTGINTITLLESPADIYSLDGRLIRKQTTNTEGLKKGLYIVNGQKMYIR